MKNKNIPNNVPTEAWEQKQVIRWKRANQIRYPQLQLLHASMNGVRVSSMRTKKQMKEQGLEKGFPDLMLDVARHGYHGLRVEMKRSEGGSLSKDQKRILEKLGNEGYFVKVCEGHKKAIETICWYLDIPIPSVRLKSIGVEGGMG